MSWDRSILIDREEDLGDALGKEELEGVLESEWAAYWQPGQGRVLP